jgi:RimJ/RimL family protein N-acetyltransferase
MRGTDSRFLSEKFLSIGKVRYAGPMNENLPPVSEKQLVVILTTPRLILRSATERDIPVMWERILGNSEVMRYVFQGVPMTQERAAEVMRKFFTFGDTLTGISVIAERPGGDLIGFGGLFPCAALGEDDLEIGFVLAPHAWGRGIATEIGAAQLAFGFERLDCRRLLGLVDPANKPSIHVLQKLGFRYLKDVAEPGRANRNVFSITAEEWRAHGREQRA